MKRTLIVFICLLASAHAHIAEAQIPEGCISPPFGYNYSGTYDGDFSGEISGRVDVFESPFCHSGTIGVVSLAFHGPFAQYFSNSISNTLTTEPACVASNFTMANPFNPIIIRGNLDPASCVVTGTWSATKPGNPPELTSGEFTMSIETAAPEDVLWTALNGDFHNASNWNPQEVPGADQSAVFDQNQSYAVSFGNPASSDKFLIERGNVTFLTSSYTASRGSAGAPSAIIGNSNNAAVLNLASHHLTTTFSTMATAIGTGGEVTVESGSTWTEQGRMIVGQGGLAFLNINDEATVTSLETQIGAEASGDGTVNVSEDISFIGDETEWTAGSLAVGLAGKGMVNHYSGSMRSDNAVIGVQQGSQGDVTLGSPNNSAIWFLNGGLTVGDRGQGELKIVEGGYLFVNSPIQLVVGGSQGSVGTVRVEGASTEIFAPDSFVIVGAEGMGTVDVLNGGSVLSGFDSVGSKGTVRIDNGEWSTKDFTIRNMGKVTLTNGTIEADDFFNLNFGGRLEGTGYINTPEATLDGTVAPGVEVDAPKGLQEGNSTRTLTFGGNVNFGGGILEIEVGGLSEGSFDVIHVTGTVDIQDATLLFRFVDGFLPRTGDTVPFFKGDGEITAANLAFAFEGVADGFQFEIGGENGIVMFHALNDAQPIVVEPTPIPTALNPNADVNGDNIIDTRDVLEIMQNWYHIVPK